MRLAIKWKNAIRGLPDELDSMGLSLEAPMGSFTVRVSIDVGIVKITKWLPIHPIGPLI